MSVIVRYELEGSGWSKCVVEVGDERVELVASYLSDALGDLLRATVSLVRGVPETLTSFADEPGEYRWRFTQDYGQNLTIRIIRFETLWANRTDDRGTIAFDSVCSVHDFAIAVAHAAQRVWDRHGDARYLTKWKNAEFPGDRLNELLRLLGSQQDSDRDRSS